MILASMEIEGIRVSASVLNGMKSELSSKIDKISNEIYEELEKIINE